MSLNGKRERFDVEDLITFAGVGGIKKTKAKSILEEISAAVADWRSHADKAHMPEVDTARIERAHRQELFV